MFNAKHVAPVVAYLCHESCADNGITIEVSQIYKREESWFCCFFHRLVVAGQDKVSLSEY